MTESMIIRGGCLCGKIRFTASPKDKDVGACKQCGTPLYYRLIQQNQFYVSSEAFDDRAGYAFTHQVFVDEKPAYYDFANKTHNMTGAEVLAEFGPAQG